MIPAATARLGLGGVAVFMSYQSLEDKIVKKALAELTANRTPPGLPVDLPDTAASFDLVTRGAEKADGMYPSICRITDGVTALCPAHWHFRMLYALRAISVRTA